MPRSWRARAEPRDQTDVTRYAWRVADGVDPAGPLVRRACERHIRDLETASRRGLEWRPEAAEEVFEFFSYLPLENDAPFRLALWQKFIIGSLFGWYRASGYRRFRTAYLEIGKGNGKTPLAAGVALYGLTCDGEGSAEIYSAAPTQKQAQYLFNDAVKMVDRSPDLKGLIEQRVSNLLCRDSFFRPVSGERRSLDGPRVHIALIDELHEHASSLVVDKMRAGIKGRKQPLIFEITNSGYDRSSVCWHHHEYSRQIVDSGLENDEWFAYVCGLDDGDDPLTDEGCWIKANPCLSDDQPVGNLTTRDYLRSQVKEATGMLSQANIVLRLNFCVWTQQHERAIDMRLWEGAPDPADWESFRGRPCFGGLDLGETDDFTAFVLVWLLENGSLAARSWFWIPEAARDRYHERPYAAWERQGLLTITEGDATDYTVVQETIRDLCHEWDVQMVGFDPRFATQMSQNLMASDIEMVKISQGYALNEACRKLDSLILDRSLDHGDHQVLSWMAGNFMTRTGISGEVRPDKQSATEKIDGIVALLMALQVSLANPPDDGPPTFHEIDIGGGHAAL